MTSLSALAAQSLQNFVHRTIESSVSRSSSSAVRPGRPFKAGHSRRHCRARKFGLSSQEGRAVPDLTFGVEGLVHQGRDELRQRASPVIRKRRASLVTRAQADTMGGVDKEERHQGKQKILAVLYKAGEYAKNPKFLACAENGLGLKDWLKEKGHEYIVTDDKEGPDSELEKQLPTIDILITTPFHPAYMNKERIQKAKKLKLIITAGVGSDHIDLHAAAEAKMTVAEVSGSNVTSVAEDEIMRVLILIRNFIPGYMQIIKDEWNVAAVAHRAYDLERKTVGTLGAGRIGQEMMKRLQNWDVDLLYYARHQNENIEKFGAKWEKDLNTFLGKCDVVSINVPLTDKTRGMIGKEQLSKMKKGAYMVNNARGDIVVREDIVEALESGQLNGYGGDVWYPQPPPKDHPWRHMPHHAMTPHLSGTTLDAQARYASGTKKILECWFEGKPLPEEDYIVREGELASQYQ